MDYFEEYDLEDHPDLDGDYEKVPGEYHNNRPVWRHVNNAYEMDHFNGGWKLIKTSNSATISKSEKTTKNMLLESDQWSFKQGNSWVPVTKQMIRIHSGCNDNCQGSSRLIWF